MIDKDSLPSVPVVVMDITDVRGFGLIGGGLTPSYNVASMASGKTHLAFVAANPSLRADGVSEEDALERLKHNIMAHIMHRSKDVKVVNLVLDELLIGEVMDG